MGDGDMIGAPRYLRIAGWLRQRVESEEFAPMARVPSEIELSRRFEVSRETVRNALDKLVAEGYLFRQAGKGTYVAARRIEHPGSTQSSLSATLDGLHLEHRTTVLVARLVPADHHVSRALHLPAGASVVCIRRLRLVDEQPVALHTTCLPEQFRGVLEHDLRGSLQALLAASGVPIVGSRDTVQAVQADEDEARLLGIARGSPLLRQEGVGVDLAGRPLRHTDSLYRGDRFRISHDTGEPSGLRWEIKPSSRRSTGRDEGDQSVGG